MFKDAQGRTWYKGNLHMHTTCSDGRLSPEEAYAFYRTHGYDFIARTDHWQVGEATEFDGMQVFSGCEYNLGSNVLDGIMHIVGVGMDQNPNIPRDATPEQVTAAIHAQNGMAIIAHPAWSLNTVEQLMPAGQKLYDMTEIYNSVSALPRNARPYSGLAVDMLAARGYALPLIATDDTHFYMDGYDVCRSYIMVQAESCTKEAIFAAIRDKKCYSTQGPALYLSVQNGRIVVDTDPVTEIVYYTDTVWNSHRADVASPGETLTHGEFTPPADCSFVRVEIKDANGNYAYSQTVTRNQWAE